VVKPEEIFAPVALLALWTGLVALVTGVRRVRAVMRGRTTPDAFRLGESSAVPADVAVANRNLMNLLEMPLLFYVVAIAFYVTRHVGPGAVELAWIYVALRLVHSCVHLTYNRVRHRLVPFALSNVVLVVLWIWFVRRVL
jgi:hypothetical protein